MQWKRMGGMQVRIHVSLNTRDQGIHYVGSLFLHNSFKLLFYLIVTYLFIIPFTVMLLANSPPPPLAPHPPRGPGFPFSPFQSPPPPHGAAAPSGSGFPHYRGFTITLRHTTLCRTPPEEWSARRGDLYLTTHNNHKRQTSMPPKGFKPAISASERLQTHALTRSATSIDFVAIC